MFSRTPFQNVLYAFFGYGTGCAAFFHGFDHRQIFQHFGENITEQVALLT